MPVSQFTCDLVTPQRRIRRGPARMVTAPGLEGEFGALPHAAPFATLLRPGLLVIETPQDGRRKFFVSGGFAEIGPEHVVILADEALALEGLERAGLEADLARARDDQANARSPERRAQAAREAARLAALRAALARA